MFESMGLPKTKETPIIYLSGHVPGVDRGLLNRVKIKYRCYSFAYCCPGAFRYGKEAENSMKASMQKGVRIMMDSGAFSFHGFLKNMTGAISAKKRKHWDADEVIRLREETIELYVEWCRQNAREWDFYCNFDYRPYAPLVYRMQRRLEKLGMRPVPVFHGDQTMAWFDRYCRDGHKLICVGTTAMQGRSTWKKKKVFYDQVFDTAEKFGVKVHGLAVTALSLMFQYPFASVDSASWAKAAANGIILFVNERRNVLDHLHVSERESVSSKASYSGMVKQAQRVVRERVEEDGFDFQKLRSDRIERSLYNAFVFTNHVHKVKEIVKETRVQWESLV